MIPSEPKTPHPPRPPHTGGASSTRARREHATLASVIRDAVDAYISEEAPDVEQALAAAFGALSELAVPSRSEWDGGVAELLVDIDVFARCRHSCE